MHLTLISITDIYTEKVTPLDHSLIARRALIRSDSNHTYFDEA